MLLLEDKYICRKSESGMERFLLTAPAFQLLARNFQEISARCQFYCDCDYLALTSAHQLKQQNPMAPQYPRHNDAVRTLRLPPQTLAHKYPRRYPRAAANNKKNTRARTINCPVLLLCYCCKCAPISTSPTALVALFPSSFFTCGSHL